NLEFGPGSYSAMDEMLALAKVVARYAGVYAIHLRSEGDKVIEAVREAIEVGRRSKVAIHISHLRLNSAPMWGKTAVVLAELATARSQGIDITADVSPFESFESDIELWVSNGPSNLTSDAVAKALQNTGGPGNVLVTKAFKHPEYAFKTVAQIATDKAM